MNNKIKDIVRLSIIAALYVVLTVLNPFSYNAIQFRISEILVLLCFFRKDYSIALIIGCFISNFFSSFMLYDIVFGTFATILACICVMCSKNIYLSIIYPILFNSIIVGFELSLVTDISFALNALYVGIGEAVVMIVGVIIFSKLRNNNSFLEMIKANQNLKNNDSEI